MEALPKTFRPVLWALGAIASVGVAYAAIGSWMDSRAQAAVQPVSESVRGLCSDVKAIRADSAATREDVAYLRGKLEK